MAYIYQSVSIWVSFETDEGTFYILELVPSLSVNGWRERRRRGSGESSNTLKKDSTGCSQNETNFDLTLLFM